MPGRFWKFLAGLVLCFVTSARPINTPQVNIRTFKDNLKNTEKQHSDEGFRPFNKECSIVSSVIARVYNHGRFEGILLIDRGRPPLGPALPGGIVRYKENPEDCVKRTLFDECCINSASNLQQFKVYSDPTRDPRMHAVDITYTVRIDDPKISSGTDAKHAWVCPLEKIPWDKLVFDHKNMLKDYLEHLITANDNAVCLEKVQLGTASKNGIRNKNDFENVAKQAYRPPHLFVAGLIEVYENNEYKGIALVNSSKKDAKLLPGGGVNYGETLEQAFQRHLKEKCNVNPKTLCQFKAYSFLNFSDKKHDITVVLLAQIDKKALGTLQVCSPDTLPENLGFHHQEVLEDYRKYHKGEVVNTCAACPIGKMLVSPVR